MRGLLMVVVFLAAGPAVAAEAADGGASLSHADQMRRDAEQMRHDAERTRHDAEVLRAEERERARAAREDSKERSREERERDREMQQNIDETVRQAMEQAREQVAHAREQMQEAMNQMRELSHEEHGGHGSHPKIGVLVREDGAPQETKGAYIEAVTPGSPAEKAGIKAGDLL
ncbi:MAG TPA: PDZ domain-containing protein, partial [Myxococcaceae bacterium]|nr:PDZ domain-containing protein [Myxococcaceae bacterium]